VAYDYNPNIAVHVQRAI